MSLRRGFLSVGLSIAAIAGYCQAPGLAWLGVVAGDNTRSASQITANATGDVYSAGSFMGMIDADLQAGEHIINSLGSMDGYIIKQNSMGEFQWVFQVGADQLQSVSTVNVDSDENIIASGYFQGTVDFDPGPGVTQFTSPSYSSFIIKLSPNGGLIWARAFNNVDGSSSINAVALDLSNNNIIIAGQVTGTADSDPSTAVFNVVSAGSTDIWFAKLNSDGNFISATRAGGPGGDYPIEIAIDANKDIVVSGMFSGTADLDPGGDIVSFTSTTGDDAFILKLNNSFGYVWAKQVRTTSQFYFGGLGTDASRNITFNGTLYGTVDFDPGTGTYNLTASDADVYLASYNPQGDFRWANSFGSDEYETGDAMAIDGSGNIFMAGRFFDAFDINPGAPTAMLVSPDEGWEQFFVKYDNNGHYLWHQVIPSGDIIDVYDMHIDVNNNIYMTGDFNGTVDFRSNTCVDGTYETSDNTHVYVVKFNPTTDIACFGFIEQPASTNVTCELQSITFKAPAGGTTNITYQWQWFNGSVWVNLVDRAPDDSANGYSGTQTGFLVILPEIAAEEGDFRVMVNGDGVPTTYSNTATLDAREQPDLPAVAATSGCGPGNYQLQAYGTFSDFVWYLGNDPIDGETSDVLVREFTADAIVSVAVSDGGCQSEKARVAVNTDACVQPPGVSWVHRIAGNTGDQILARAMALDEESDYVYIAGTFYGPTDFDPNTGQFDMDPANGSHFLAKYSQSGVFVWAIQTHMLIMDIVVRRSNGGFVYLGGMFSGTVDLDPGPGTANMTAFSFGQDMAIVKLNDDGDFVWAKQLAGSTSDGENYIQGIAEDANEDIIITGNFTGGMDFNPDTPVVSLTSVSNSSDTFVAKYDEDGTFLWVKRVGNNVGETALDVKTDSESRIHVVGLFIGTVDFNPDAGVFNLIAAGQSDGFYLELDQDGSFRNAKKIGGAGSDRAVSVAIDNSDTPVIAGHFAGTVNFDLNGGTFNMTANSLQQSYLVKVTPVVANAWAKLLAGYVTDIKSDNNSNVFATGYFGSRVDFDPGPDTYFLQTAVTSDIYVVRFDETGNFQWAYNTNASGIVELQNESVAIEVNSAGNIFLVGSFMNSIDADPTHCTYPLIAYSGAQEMFFQHIRPDVATICYVVEPKDTQGCEGAETHLIAEATGTTDISYKWQRYNTSFGYFEDLVPGPGFSGINTPELIINTTSTFGDGIYRALAVGDNVSSSSSNTANVTVSSVPSPPAFTPISYCAPGVKILNVSGGTNGDYRWRETAGSTPIVGAVNDTFTTPFLTSTKSWSVTRIVSGCESAPQTATATINLTISPPAVTNGSSCSSPANVTLEASGATGGNNYYWYQNATDEDVMADEYDPTFVTSLINATTTYYVAIGDGTCESLRVAIVAQIGTAATPVGSTVNNCGPGAITLTATGGTNGEYRWYTQSSGGTPIAGAVNNSYVTPAITATTQYYVSLDNGSCESSRVLATAVIDTPPTAPTANGTAVCTNAPAALTASATATGQFRWYAAATGGAVLHTGATYTTPNLPATTTYYVTIFDTKCESMRTAVVVTVNSCATNAPPAIATSTSSTGIQGTVTVNLNPLLSDPDNNLDLATLKIISQPKSGAAATIDQNGQLSVDYTGIAFTGQDELTIEVCDSAGSCVQQVVHINVSGEMMVYNAVSPNGDGKNDVFHLAFIDVIEETRANKVTIFNRWGDLVFEIENYNNTSNVFSGKNKNGNDLPSGTYFYRIEFRNSGRKTETGYLSLKR